MQVSKPSSTSLKCPTCRISFDQDLQHKNHYKSDLHRYNLKRSMVNLAPATFQQFSTKRSQVRTDRPTNFQCGQCKKTFGSLQTLNQHAESKRHDINRISVQILKTPKQQKVFVKNEKQCLFCAKQFQKFEDSIKHMSIEHSFFIAQSEYCSDKPKLILYLQQKIQVGMMCIFCDNKGCKDFATGEAVMKHMVAKRHTFMNTQNGFEEYENFYDFSQLFNEKLKEQKLYATPVGINFEKVKVIVDNDQQEAMQMKKSKKEAENKLSKQNEMEDQQDEYQQKQGEQEWQDESDEEQAKQAVIEAQDKQQMKEKRRRKVRAYKIMVPTLTSTDQLLLPNGKTLGHRKYKHLYRQTLKISNWVQTNKLKMLQFGVANQQALMLKNNMLQLVKKDQIMKTIMRNQDKKYVQSGIQNSNLYRHFRSSNPK